MGLHTGEAELRDGDYYGGTLNRASFTWVTCEHFLVNRVPLLKFRLDDKSVQHD